tara:strand:+ start:1200 stop:1520 length:321 start_codon:yes stop_codon:yes gene_type:complete
MLPFSVYAACFALALSGTVLAKYVIEFINFTKEQKYKERLEDINRRVDELLAYRFEDKEMNGQIIDITDYMEYEQDLFMERDTILEEMCSQRLIYSPQLKAWIKNK